MRTEISRLAALNLAAAAMLTVLNAPFSVVLAQGSLTPPGAPAPTMKTLDQIEPRTPISSLPFTITNAGSYYFTTNLVGASGQNGVTITANDVTLDLSGFNLAGVTGSSNGIAAAGVTGLLVRNGALRGWGWKGVSADTCEGGVFERLRISGSGSWGLISGFRSTIRDCTAIYNSGGGILAEEHSLVIGCLSAANSGDGFLFPNSATARDCVAKDNGNDGISGGDVSTFTACTSRDNGGGVGFSVGAGSVVSGCTATANGKAGIFSGENSVVKDCSIRNCGDGGIVAGNGSTISGCAVCYINGAAGIQVQAGCIVLNNTCNFMNDDNTPAIRAQSTGSRIEGNTVCSNYWGIVIEGTGNFIFRNTAAANSSGNYTNAPGNVVGEILNVSGGATITSANPWANFSY